ncbi:MAG TPA: helix-turn-helix domain-containing protein [Polyangiaceae bacterium]|nr:helix-turn-helix domain-containing protein [Polyangiaceae bacterium]
MRNIDPAPTVQPLLAVDDGTPILGTSTSSTGVGSSLCSAGEFIKLPVVAEYFGVPVSTVRQWVRSGRLPSIKPGRHRLVRQQDFELFCTRNARGAAQEARNGL